MNPVDFIMEQIVVAEELISDSHYREASLMLRDLLGHALEEVESLVDQRNALEEVVWHHGEAS